jgi:maltooligosyltrehalose trehalohydrolase
MASRSGTSLSGQAFFGAIPSHDGVLFRIWAPDVESISLELLDGAAAGSHPLAAAEAGTLETWVPGAGANDRYVYLVDGAQRCPDPASRFQPEGVHGPSMIVDPAQYRWHDEGWRPRTPRDAVVYELHVGAFTADGTFAAAQARLPYLRDLGITVVELMPVADFAGSRNWGYDGVALFAPSRAYGRPDDLRAFVDAAHALGLAVTLDVVYNHLGPEGAYLPRFSRRYHTDRHTTPWGNAVNLDGPGSALVRRFIVDNAVHWIREYHFDGLRLDATHALVDDSDPNIVVELVDAVRAAGSRPVLIHAEDHRNLAAMVEDVSVGGWGLDGVWADDFHHVLRRMIAGDAHGYFRDFAGEAQELTTILREGWLYTGQLSSELRKPRGSSAARVAMHRFVVCLQNHDQVGNRALGDRLHHAVPAEVWRAASTLLLTVPMTPLLFMGQEWSASTPFQYFTDLEPDLGRLVTDGRRKEFAAFPEFSSDAARERIPDPQSAATLLASRLKWDEQAQPEHARVLALYRELLALRHQHPSLSGSDERRGEAAAPDDQTIVMRREGNGDTFWIVVRFKSAGDVDLGVAAAALGNDAGHKALETILDTEHAEFAADPRAVTVSAGGGSAMVHFARAGAIILRER